MSAELAAPFADARPRLRASIWLAAVWVGTAIYSVALAAESIADHHRFRTGLDTAIYDQLLWELAHWHTPFESVISRPMLGDHFHIGTVLFTPLYWLGLGVPGLLAAQAIGLALTAPVLYALARHFGASPRLASIPALLWLACPWVASANLFEFHPATFAPPLLALSVLAAVQRRDVLLAVTTLLALSLKEDIALTYVALGILMAIHGRRRAGAVVGVVSAVWFVAASEVVDSLAGSYKLFGERFAGDRGSTVGQALVWELHHPLRELSDIAVQSLPDLLLLFLSTAGLPLLAASWMLLALPTAAHNALSDYSPQHDLSFHYHLGTVAGLFIAAAIGAPKLASLGRTGRIGFGLFLVMAVAVALIGGDRMHAHPGTALRLDPAATDRALSVIPKDAPVAATLSLLPHLSQRDDLYTLPEPFVPIDWGASLTPAQLRARAARVRWVAYIKSDQVRRVTTGAHPKLFPDVRQTLVRQGFVVVSRAGPLEVFERK